MLNGLRTFLLSNWEEFAIGLLLIFVSACVTRWTMPTPLHQRRRHLGKLERLKVRLDKHVKAQEELARSIGKVIVRLLTQVASAITAMVLTAPSYLYGGSPDEIGGRLAFVLFCLTALVLFWIAVTVVGLQRLLYKSYGERLRREINELEKESNFLS